MRRRNRGDEVAFSERAIREYRSRASRYLAVTKTCGPRSTSYVGDQMTVDMADKVVLRRVWRQPNQSIREALPIGNPHTSAETLAHSKAKRRITRQKDDLRWNSTR